MSLLKPFLIAFSTYTSIPLPKVHFEQEDMRYSMCFFPLVGMVVGLVFWLWGLAADALRLGALLKSAGFVLSPLLVTGGIHMDGFLDTADALASWQPREKKLDILKDSHVGAFAVIRCGMYLLAMLGLYSEVKPSTLALVSLGFVFSRSLTVLMLNLLPNARGSGMLKSFQQIQDRRVVLAVAGLMSALALAAGLFISPPALLAGAAALAVSALWFYFMAQRRFGGITGDLAGYLIQWAELAFVAGIILLEALL